MEPITLTATAIATLAFQKFLETGAGELGQKFTTVAIAKMDELRQMIWDKLRGNSKAENALTSVEKGSKQELDRLAVYLWDVMEDDPQFASQVQAIAQQINAGKLQDNSSIIQHIHDHGTGIISKAEPGSDVKVAKEMKIYYPPPND